MKTKFNFFIISTAVFILSVIAICCAPIINKLFYDFENWKSLNCDLYSDLADSHEIELKDEDNYRYLKNLCRRQKATYNLEYASLTISTSLSFICFYLSLLLRLNIGKEYKNNIGLIGFIFGIICFILTLIYLCFSGYIFTNDIAFGIVGLNSFRKNYGIKKLFPNGATYKWSNNKYITAYEEDIEDNSDYIKYKDLGDKRYNYDKTLYEKFDSDDPCCRTSGSSRPISYINTCDYIFDEPNNNISNKYLYDRWMTTLILNCFIILFDLFLIISGFMLYKDQKEEVDFINNSKPKIIQIDTNRNNLDILNINDNIDKNKIDENEEDQKEEIKQDINKKEIDNDIDNNNININKKITKINIIRKESIKDDKDKIKEEKEEKEKEEKEKEEKEKKKIHIIRNIRKDSTKDKEDKDNIREENKKEDNKDNKNDDINFDDINFMNNNNEEEENNNINDIQNNGNIFLDENKDNKEENKNKQEIIISDKDNKESKESKDVNLISNENINKNDLIADNKNNNDVNINNINNNGFNLIDLNENNNEANIIEASINEANN